MQAKTQMVQAVFRDTGMITDLIDKENNRVSKKLIGECWDCYKKWYGSSASWLMADIYSFAGDKVKKEISALAYLRIRGMETGLLRCYMENDILRFTDEIKDALLDQCQRFFKLNERQRGKSGNNQSPLTHILRLWQKGKIPETGVFCDYKELDPWFSFVCFPEEFDYREFDVKRWYTWLGEERYTGEAFAGPKAAFLISLTIEKGNKKF